jgi:hypothetical protein
LKRINIETTEEHHEAMSWCLKNNIKIYPKVVKNGFRIEINDNGKLIRSPKVYLDLEVQLKMWELYLYFYKKFKK